MKITEISKLGLTKEALTEVEIDPVKAIVHDEFLKKIPGNYRERVINRLSELNLPIHSEFNIAYELMLKFVKITCPYCPDSTMEIKTGSGDGSSFTGHYRCPKCNAEGHLTVSENGLGFNPKR